MTLAQALLGFTAAAAVMTVTPGLDTALVLRTAAVEGAKRALFAAVGVVCGCLAWGALVAFGLATLVRASPLVFQALRWAGAAYLLYLGANLALRPRRSFDPGAAQRGTASDCTWMRRGLLTNLMNPKAGVFYVSFLPQFLPAGVAVGPFIVLLTLVHAVMALSWFAVLAVATQPLARALRRRGVVTWLDRSAGAVLVAFGLRLAISPET